MNRSLATMVRSFELANATSRLGPPLTLAFMHPGFTPPSFFLEMLANSISENYKIRYRSVNSPLEHGTKYRVAGKVTECRPSALGLIKQMGMSFQYVRDEFPLVREEKPDVIVARPDHVLSFLVTAGAKRIPLGLETGGPVEGL